MANRDHIITSSHENRCSKFSGICKSNYEPVPDEQKALHEDSSLLPSISSVVGVPEHRGPIKSMQHMGHMLDPVHRDRGLEDCISRVQEQSIDLAAINFVQDCSSDCSANLTKQISDQKQVCFGQRRRRMTRGLKCG